MKRMQIWTLIIGILGALAWTPWVIEILKPAKINGKLFSIYENKGIVDTDKRIESTQLIFKIGLLCQNKNYNLKDFYVNVHFEKSGWKELEVMNTRHIVFTSPEGIHQKLIVPKKDFLINKILLPKETAFDCYIFGFVRGYIDERISEVEITFNSFNQKDKKLLLKRDETSEYKKLYDDDIWCSVDMPVN